MGSIDEMVGQRVRSYRRAARLTQAELASMVGVSSETVSRLERGVGMPSLSRLHEIGQALGAELHELLRVEGSRSAKTDALARLIAVASQGEATDVEALATIAEVFMAQLQRRSV